MRQLFSHVRSHQFSFLLLSVGLFLSLASPVFGQTWTGSSGAVDESSRSIYLVSDSAASIQPGVATGTAVLRYNIVPAGNLGQQINLVVNCWSMGVRYLDNGSNSQVTVALKEHNLTSGAINTLLTFDSNTAPQGNTFQNGNPLQCGFFNFNFASSSGNQQASGKDSVYYFEAKLTRSGSGGTPALDAIWITLLPAQ